MQSLYFKVVKRAKLVFVEFWLTQKLYILCAKAELILTRDFYIAAAAASGNDGNGLTMVRNINC